MKKLLPLLALSGCAARADVAPPTPHAQRVAQDLHLRGDLVLIGSCMAIAAAVLFYLSLRLPLISGRLRLIAGAILVAGMAAMGLSAVLPFLWILPLGLLVVGLFEAVRHLVSHHDALTEFAGRVKTDAVMLETSISGKAKKLWQSIVNRLHHTAVVKPVNPPTEPK